MKAATLHSCALVLLLTGCASVPQPQIRGNVKRLMNEEGAQEAWLASPMWFHRVMDTLTTLEEELDTCGRH